MPGAREIQEPTGKLGMLTQGIGAVATTFFAGVELINKGLAEPIGSLTQFGTIRLGKRTENQAPQIKDFVPLAGMNDLVFGGWDAFPDDAYEAGALAGVLNKEHLNAVRERLKEIKPFPAVFDPRHVARIGPPTPRATVASARPLSRCAEISALSKRSMTWTG